MDIYNISSEQMDELVDEYLDAMAQAQYDYYTEVDPYIKRTETDRTDEDLPF